MSDEVDYEKEASALGWVPLEKFKGDEDKWVDAETFVERGKHVMPILKKNNERLREELLTRDAEIDTLKQQLSATNAIVERLEKSYNEGTKRALEAQRKELRASLIEAKKENDVEAELDIQDQLDNLKQAEADAAKKQQEESKTLTKPINQDPDSGFSPEFQAWKKENPWFGTDKKKTKAIMRAAEDLRDEGETATGAEFFELAAERAFPDDGGEEEESPRKPVSKVESGNASRGTSSTRKGSFGSLPKDAQEACMQDADTLVGPGKKFKELKDWQNYYTKVYFGEQV